MLPEPQAVVQGDKPPVILEVGNPDHEEAIHSAYINRELRVRRRTDGQYRRLGQLGIRSSADFRRACAACGPRIRPRAKRSPGCRTSGSRRTVGSSSSRGDPPGAGDDGPGEPAHVVRCRLRPFSREGRI